MLNLCEVKVFRVNYPLGQGDCHRQEKELLILCTQDICAKTKVEMRKKCEVSISPSEKSARGVNKREKQYIPCVKLDMIANKRRNIIKSMPITFFPSQIDFQTLRRRRNTHFYSPKKRKINSTDFSQAPTKSLGLN